MNGGLDDAPVEAGDNLPHILAGTHIAAVDLNLAAEQQPQMQFGAQPAGGAAGAVASAGAQGAKAVGPDVGAHMVHHQVHAGAAGDFSHPLGDVLLVVVDDIVGAQVAGQLRLFGGAGGGDDGGAHHIFEYLNGGGADAGRCGEHQRRFPGLQGGAAHGHIPDRQAGGGNGGGGGERYAFVQRVGVDFGDGHEFGVAAVNGSAEKAAAAAQFVAPGATSRADAASQAGVHHYPVAGFQGSHAVAGGDYFAGRVAAQNERGRKLPLQSALPLAGKDVQAVKGAGAYFYDHIAGAWSRLGAVAVLENAGVAVGFNIDGFHRRLLLLPVGGNASAVAVAIAVGTIAIRRCSIAGGTMQRRDGVSGSSPGTGKSRPEYPGGWRRVRSGAHRFAAARGNGTRRRTSGRPSGGGRPVRHRRPRSRPAPGAGKASLTRAFG